MAEQLPSDFGPYVLLELIARGGMAEIYRAKQRNAIEGFEKQVAIKKILPNLAVNDEFITMLRDEANICSVLNHSNIAKVYDLGRVGETYYIAMEYVQGIDLAGIIKQLAKRGYLIPLDHAIFITSELFAGLYFAHNKLDAYGEPLNIIHRDVSPHNVMISFNGETKLIDFGVAKASVKLGQTRMGVIKGKLLYMAPEQAMARPLDHRVDLFAAGLILYKLLTGRLPFEADNEFQIYNKVLTAQIVPPKAINPDTPDALNAIVMKTLQRDPNQRYQDGLAAQHALKAVLQMVSPGYTFLRLQGFMEQYFGDKKPANLTAPARRSSIDTPALVMPSNPAGPLGFQSNPHTPVTSYPHTPVTRFPAPARGVHQSSPQWEQSRQPAAPIPSVRNPQQVPGFNDPVDEEDVTAPHDIMSVPHPSELGFVGSEEPDYDDDNERTVDMSFDPSLLNAFPVTVGSGADGAEPTVNMGMPVDGLGALPAAPAPAPVQMKRRRPRKKKKGGMGLLVALALVILLLTVGGIGAALFFSGALVPPSTDDNEPTVVDEEEDNEEEPEPNDPSEALSSAGAAVASAIGGSAREYSHDVTITLNSVPEGAAVLSGRKELGRTPLSVGATRSRKTIKYLFRLKGFSNSSAEIIPDRDRSTSVILRERGPIKKPQKPSKGALSNEKPDDDGLIDPW